MSKEVFHCNNCIYLVRDVRWEDWDCTHIQRPQNATIHDIEFHRRPERPDWCPLSEEAINNMENTKIFDHKIKSVIKKLQKVRRGIQTGTHVIMDDTTIDSLFDEGVLTNEKRRRQMREALADNEHDSWSGWMKYMFSKCLSDTGSKALIIPEELVERWKRQMDTPYKDLPESEKKSDREEADKVIDILLTEKGENVNELKDQDDFGERLRQLNIELDIKIQDLD